MGINKSSQNHIGKKLEVKNNEKKTQDFSHWNEGIGCCMDGIVHHALGGIR
jgi:hypothetical protein